MVLYKSNRKYSTGEASTTFPDTGDSLFTAIQDLKINRTGVAAQLNRLNAGKAGGPDDISARLLSDYSEHLSDMLSNSSHMNHMI